MRSTKLPSWIERTLGFDPRPVPPHVFALERGLLRYGCFVRRGDGFSFQEYHALPLPEELFSDGPLGGPPAESGSLTGLVRALLDRVSAPVKAASLVLPDGWLRVAFVEVGELPRAAATRDEILRFKLRRLVPFRVDELRVVGRQVAAIAGQEEPLRVLVGFGVESLLAACERAFEECGVTLGQITSASLAVASALAARSPSSGLTALAHLQPEGYTLLLARGDEPVVVRLKPFAAGLPEEERAALVGQELRLTRSYIAERLPGEALGSVVLAAPSEVAKEWLRVLTEGLDRPAVALSAALLPLTADGASAPWIELAPMLGAACREVA